MRGLHCPLVTAAHPRLGGGVYAPASQIVSDALALRLVASDERSFLARWLQLALPSLLSLATLPCAHPLSPWPHTYSPFNEEFDIRPLSSPPQVLTSFWVSLASVIHVQTHPHCFQPHILHHCSHTSVSCPPSTSIPCLLLSKFISPLRGSSRLPSFFHPVTLSTFIPSLSILENADCGGDEHVSGGEDGEDDSKYV